MRLDVEEVVAPQPGPQINFLNSDADIAIFGGAAGSGKSWALLLEAMRYPATRPGFDSVMFRRNTTDLRRPGGLWPESARLFPFSNGIPVSHQLTWKWPGYGTVKMAHLEHETDVLAWHGAQVPCICFDELTTFTRYQFFYLMSRNRGTTGVRPYIRASCNADAGSWVASLIEWWIRPETGYPIPERSGVIRYFVRGAGDELIWFDSKQEAMEKTGRGPETIKSLTFISAKLADNPALMRNDPNYLGNLMMLPQVERERLLNGNWKIRPSGGLFFNRSWVRVVDIAPAHLQSARGWDLAATPETPETDPDWTCGTKIGRTNDGKYIVLDHKYIRGSPADVERLILNTASQDGFEVQVGLPQDPGQAGKAQVASFVRLMAGYTIEASPETGDKVTRFSPFSSQAEHGNVLVLRAPWNERWFTTLESFPNDGVHDDDCDSTARAFSLVAEGSLGLWLKM
jgi:predicted phage terminase large subunit-like protein